VCQHQQHLQSAWVLPSLLQFEPSAPPKFLRGAECAPSPPAHTYHDTSQSNTICFLMAWHHKWNPHITTLETNSKIFGSDNKCQSWVLEFKTFNLDLQLLNWTYTPNSDPNLQSSSFTASSKPDPHSCTQNFGTCKYW
jgi:hypothetical protein